MMTVSAFVLGAVFEPLFFLVLFPGVLVVTILGFGHAEAVLLAVPVTWVAYYWMLKWLFRRI